VRRSFWHATHISTEPREVWSFTRRQVLASYAESQSSALLAFMDGTLSGLGSACVMEGQPMHPHTMDLG
jgi:hypothetical protein